MATINHKTYNEGTETFKDFSVYDGKDTLIFKVDGSSGGVGIGTTTADAKLQVVGAFAQQIRFGTNTSIYTNLSMGTGFTTFDSIGGDSGAYSFRDDGVTRLFIDASGNVGIGTSAPKGQLDIIHGNTDPVGLQDVAIDALRLGRSGGGVTAIRSAQYDSVGQPAAGDIQFLNLFFNGSTYNYYERVRIRASGGITFNGDTAAANALDDYEEGTFTPTAFGVTTAGTTTYTGQNGYYTKIGRQVTVSIYVGYSSLTGTGDMRIGGLPFVIGNFTENYPVGSCIPSSVNWTGGTYLQAIGFQNESNLYIAYIADDTSSNVQQCVDEAATFRITMTYFTA